MPPSTHQLCIPDFLDQEDIGYVSNGSNDDDYHPLFTLSPMQSLKLHHFSRDLTSSDPATLCATKCTLTPTVDGHSEDDLVDEESAADLVSAELSPDEIWPGFPVHDSTAAMGYVSPFVLREEDRYDDASTVVSSISTASSSAEPHRVPLRRILSFTRSVSYDLDIPSDDERSRTPNAVNVQTRQSSPEPIEPEPTEPALPSPECIDLVHHFWHCTMHRLSVRDRAVCTR